MFEIFITIFGVIFVVFKIAIENTQIKVSARESELKRQCDAVIKCLIVAPKAKIAEVEEYIESGQNTEDIYNKLSGFLSEVFGDNYRDCFILPGSKTNVRWQRMSLEELRKNHIYLPRSDFTREYSAVDWAKHLLLSLEGMVDENAYYFGYELGNVNYCYNNIKLGKIMIKNIKKYHKSIDLYIEPAPIGTRMRFDHQNYSTWKKKYLKRR